MVSIPPEVTGTVVSDDVTLFYRLFGDRNGEPLLLLHGGNYYDSLDWHVLAQDLGHCCHVVAFDRRGFAESAWSSSRDYSMAAHIRDIEQLMDHLGLARAVVAGHSIGGIYAMAFAVERPERVAGLVLIDHCPMALTRAMVAMDDNATYASLEEAHAATSRSPKRLDDPHEYERWAKALRKEDAGYRLKRDPAFANLAGVVGGSGDDVVFDGWAAVAQVRAPMLVVAAADSKRYTAEKLTRLLEVQPAASVVNLPGGHDLLAEAPNKLADAIMHFIATLKSPQRA